MPTLTPIVPANDASAPCNERALGHYRDTEGTRRTIVAVDTEDGGTLVVDHRDGAFAEPRLVAHLDANDEALTLDPAIDNAHLVVELYLRDHSRGRCRLLQPSDLRVAPAEPELPSPTQTLASSDGARCRIRVVRSAQQRELRWVTSTPAGQRRAVSLRRVIGALEHYEPARSMTIAALARYSQRDDGVQCRRLRDELRRLDHGPCVLNRGLREAVMHAVEGGEISLSEIAKRCERNHGGAHDCGDTSWLKRRIGLMPDFDAERPTPWLRSETLALIARHGLGVAPWTVEV